MRNQSQKDKQKGFTLISTIIAVAIASVVILGLGTVLSGMFHIMRGAEVMGDGTDIVGQIRMNFENPEMCDTALGSGFTFNASATGGSAASISSIPLLIHGNLVNFTEGSEIAPGLILKSIDLITLTKSGDREVISLKGSAGVPVDAYRYQGLIRVQMTRKTGAQTAEQPPSFVPVTFTTTSSGASGTISNCGSTAVSQATCESLNYVWDTASKTCLQANECSYGGSYSNTGGAVGSFVNPFTGGYTCPVDALGEHYDAIRSGSISWAVQSGKYGVTSNIYPVFACMICKDANGHKTAFNATTLTAINNLTLPEEVTTGLPSGSYAASCQTCTFDSSNVLKCSCKTTAGTWHNTTLNTTSCSGDISNINGTLACLGSCSSKTGSGSGLASYGCMCSGAATCMTIGPAPYIPYPINYCTETCSDGSHWYQMFDSAGTPTSSPTHY